MSPIKEALIVDVLLFHHIQGLTSGVSDFADDLRAAGHTVHTPNLFDGRTFDSIEDGASYLDELGFATLLERGRLAAAEHPDASVFAGFSLGVVPAQMLAQTEPRTQGAVFLEACLPVSEFSDAWPTGVAVQIHGMSDDPFFSGDGDIDNAAELVEQAQANARAELFVYDGDRHLFTDRSVAAHDPEPAALVLARVLDFLAAIDR